jgi:DNA invertase Pin-like site-specific DNA recombinase
LVALANLNTNTPVKRGAPSDRSTQNRALRRRVLHRDRNEIVRLYQSGLSTRAVAREVGVSKTTVLSVLTGAGVKMRPRGKMSVDG